MATPVTEKSNAPIHCAYCDAPITDAVNPAASGKRYCCYGCRLLGESGHKAAPAFSSGLPAWFKLVLGGVLAGQSMLIGLSVNLSPPEGAARWLLHGLLLGITAAVFGLLGWPLVRTSWQAIRQKSITIELLFVAGVAGALGASLYSTLSGQGDVYYEVVAILLTVYAVGKAVGAESRARALSESRKLAEAFDTCRCLQPDGTILERKVDRIQAGDRVQVYSGEAIPVDGRILRGQAFIRETPMSGEPFPVVRRPGDEVLAGSYAEDGDLVVISSVDGCHRRLDGLLRAVEQARDLPSTMQAQADRLVAWFLPLVLVAALGAFVFWTARESWRTGLFNSLAVLLVACPCAMGLATPIGLWNGLAMLASRGLVARSGNLIDQLGRVTGVVYDKTGTLSEDALSLIDLAHRGGERERAQLMEMVRAAQVRCPHPVARAFLSASQPVPPGHQVKSIKTIPAKGIEAWVIDSRGDEHYLRMGGRDLVSDLPGEPGLLAGLRYSPGDHLIYIEVDGRLEGVAAVRERLRDTTRQAMLALGDLGIQCRVMTGDSLERAASLGLDNVQGGMTPQDKSEAIGRLQLGGERICFVGDGINDAPALLAAQAGIALDHGAGLATATAGAVLHGGDLRIVPWAIEVCRQVRGSIHSNLCFAAVYNVAGIILALSGNLHPVAASLLMVFSSFTVSWRALRSSRDGAYCCAPYLGNRANSALNQGARHWDRGGDEPSPPQPGHWHVRPNVPRFDLAARRQGGLASRWRVGVDLVLGKSHRFQALLMIFQVPFVIYLGQLGLWPSTVVATAYLAIAWNMFRFRSSHPEWRRVALMTFAMLGAGNWGMLLGWWADSGFSPVIYHGASYCCATPGGFSLAGILRMPWMNLGMLLFGLPPMLADRAVVRNGLARFSLGLLSALGMILGMSFGSYLFVKWFGPVPSQRFLISLAGMTIGMLAGMHFCCEMGRALFMKWRYPR